MTEAEVAAADGILRFLGYGNPSAPLWFIGIEEGLGAMNDSDIISNLSARSKFDEMFIVQGGRPYNLSQREKFSPVWLWIARVARAMEDASDWPDLCKAKNYIQSQLDRSNGGTFLTYASPIPEKALGSRKWKEYFRKIVGNINVEKKKADRAAKIYRMIEQHQPDFVICHGISAVRDFEAFLPSVEPWKHAEKSGSFLISKNSQGCRYLISPFFGNGQMSLSLVEEMIATLKQGDFTGEAGAAGVHRAHSAAFHVSMPSSQAAHATARRIAVQSGGCGSYMKCSSGVDPKETIAVLDQLVCLGFNDDAFWRLHHKRMAGQRETIRGFRAYCVKVMEFRRGGTNHRVHERLVEVLRRCSGNEGADRGNIDFVQLAEMVFANV